MSDPSDQTEVAMRCSTSQAFDPQVKGMYKLIAKYISSENNNLKFVSADGREFLAFVEDVGTIQPNFWYEIVVELDDTPRDVLRGQLLIPLGDNFNTDKFLKLLEFYVSDPIFFQPESHSRLYKA